MNLEKSEFIISSMRASARLGNGLQYICSTKPMLFFAVLLASYFDTPPRHSHFSHFWVRPYPTESVTPKTLVFEEPATFPFPPSLGGIVTVPEARRWKRLDFFF